MPSLIINIKLVGLFIFFLVISLPVWADDKCPNETDTVYCKIAHETGGKVYSGKDVQKNLNLLVEEENKSNKRNSNPTSNIQKYSSFSKDLGCKKFAEARSREVCNSISENLEWGWTGHATITPGWKANWNTAKNVYCSKNITEADLPILEKMCGEKIHPYMSCLKPTDWRLAVGVENLIKIVLGRKHTPDDLNGTIFDLENINYILKDGCQK